MAKFVTNASSATWWPKLEPMLIALHIGRITNQCWWRHLVFKFWTYTSGTTLVKFVTNASGILSSWRDNSSLRVNTLGPLCLWQCLVCAWKRLFVWSGWIYCNIWFMLDDIERLEQSVVTSILIYYSSTGPDGIHYPNLPRVVLLTVPNTDFSLSQNSRVQGNN